MKNLLFLVLLFVTGAVAATPSTLTLGETQLAQLDALKVGSHLLVDGFPDGYGGTTSLRFERIEVYAPGARIVGVDAGGEHDLPRSPRIQLIGASADGSVRTSLSFDPRVQNIAGVGSAPSGAFAIRADRSNGRVTLRATPIAQTLPAGVSPEILGGDDSLPSGSLPPDALTLALAAAPSGTLRGAIVAIDTDNELMSERFGNNTTAATNWIADLFAAMNVMYERDLDVALQQGTTFLRTTADPYTQNSTVADDAQLNEFGAYWQSHYGAVSRSFAALLSGKAADGNHASGIAWINSYCQTQASGGSYSFTEVFTNSQVDVFYSALIVGHELGHNFGAYHTHCTNIAGGGAPTATNTIDKCYNAEAGCYNGVTSCPTSGPGAPAGTIMSYCNIRGCGSDGQNVLQFHPTQITVLNALIAQNTPECINPTADIIFENGFD